MRTRFKTVLTALAVVVLSVAALVPVAGASGMMGTPSPSPSSTMMATPMPTPPSTMMPTPSASPTPGTPGAGWCAGGTWSGTGAWGGTGMWGTGSGMAWLTGDPDALAVWTQLRVDHQRAMKAWYDTYRSDLAGPEAQRVLHDLWTKTWNDMKAFYETYADGATWTAPSAGMWGRWDMGGMMGRHGWDASHMWGTGYGASWMMGHRRAFGQWLTMRGKQTTAMSAWQHRYAADPDGAAAQTALRTARAHQRAQIKSFYRHHGLSVTTARMRSGAGGWMGLGGMWGGFGW